MNRKQTTGLTGVVAIMVLSLMVVLPQTTAQEPSEPFVEVDGNENTVQTARHAFKVADTGLPEQILIKPVKSELPLGARENENDVGAQELRRIGRGPQLRAPMQLRATVKGQKAEVKVQEAASRTGQGAGAWTYTSSFSTGPVDVNLELTYRYDGALFGTVTYSGDGTEIDNLQLEMPVAGPVSLAYSGTRAGKSGIAATKGLDASVPGGTDQVVWKNTTAAKERGAGQAFANYLFFGSPDRGFTWMSSGGDGWQTDDSAPMMELARNENGAVTWRVKLVNQKTVLEGEHEVSFGLMVHPARPPESNRRKKQWLSWPVDRSPDTIRPDGLSLQKRTELLGRDTTVTGALAGGALEAVSAYRELNGAAGADLSSPEEDTIDLYPNSLFTVFSGTYTGQTTRIRSNIGETIEAGDNPAFDRQILGRALLHDIGVAPDGVTQPIQYVRLVKELKSFGFFKPSSTEVLPYWRNGEFIRYGEEYKAQSRFALSKDNPTAGVYVTVYRRPREDGGYKALIVLMNTRDESIRERLHILQPERIFGGQNQLTWRNIVSQLDFSGTDGLTESTSVQLGPSDWRKGKVLGSVKDKMALKDLEEDGTVLSAPKQPSGAEIYGPVFIRAHDYRILYGYSGK